MTKHFVRVIAVVALVISISACNKPTAPSGATNPSPTGQVIIPAPDMGHLDQAWIRYHRPEDKPIYAPSKDSVASVFGFTYLAPGAPSGQTAKLADCLSEAWDQTKKDLTCLAQLGQFPTDVEIQVRVGDPAVATDARFSANSGRDIFINQVKIPSRVTSNGEEGYFKLSPNGTVYW